MKQRIELSQSLALAFSHYAAGRLGEARRLAREMERQRPDLPGLPYLQGLLALADGNGRKAAQALVRALAQTPDAPPPLLAMARAQAAQERTVEAIAAYRRVLAVAPGMSEAHLELGELLLRSGDADAALPHLRQAAILHPDRPVLHNILGVAERQAGHIDAAALAFARAIDLDPGFAKAHANLAALLRRLKRSAEALANAERAVALAPDQPDHWLELGLARRDNGDIDGARQAFATAVDQAPQSVEAAWLLAETLRARGEVENAAATYQRVLALAPADPFGAALALAALDAAPIPDRAPDAYLRRLYDQYADSFEQDLVDNLGYQGPAAMAAAIRRMLGAGPFDIFDIGCGTGLMGATLKPLASRLDGVDLSPRMVEKARARGIYDTLTTGDLVTALTERPHAYSLITAADVLIYFGDLVPLLSAAADALRPAGALVFSVERGEGTGYTLGATGRYAHSESYLRHSATATGFAVVTVEDMPLRTERRHPVPALLTVLRKP
jgi:predicted TPR repeat methyltransferase